MRTVLLALLLVRGLLAQPLVLLPKVDQIPCGQTVQFRVPGWDPKSLHWQADRGKIDAQGLFTAPGDHGPCRIFATDWQDVNRTVSAQARAVEISLRAQDHLSLHPREEGRILVQLAFRGGEYDRKLIWRMESPSAENSEPQAGIPGAAAAHDGQVDATGWVKAPSQEGSYLVEILLAADPRIRATVQLEVMKARPGRRNVRGEPVQVRVQPAKVEIHSGEYQSFSSSVAGADVEEIAWSLVEGSRDAEVDPSGTFRASKPGTYHLRATSFQYPECWGEAEIVVGPSVNGILKPEDAPKEDLVGATPIQAGAEEYLILGGWDGKAASTQVLRLDLAAKGLSPLLRLQVPRARGLAAKLTDGTILVAGGIGVDGRSAVQTAERLDVERKAAWKVGEAHWAHIGGLMQALPGGRALLLGGTEPDGTACGLEVFESGPGAFTVLDRRPWPAHATALTRRNGQVLIVGGELNGRPQSLVWQFDPRSNGLTPFGKLRQARSRCTATLLWDDAEVIVIGGRGPRGALSSVERISLVNGASSPGGNLLAPREGHAAILIPTGQILVFGGGDGPKASRLLEDWSPDGNGCQVRDHLESGAWLPFLGLQLDGSTFVYGLAEAALGKVPLPPAWEAWN
jgi:hypothetical protein